MVDDDMGSGEPPAHSSTGPWERPGDPEAEKARLTVLLREAQQQVDATVAERTAAVQVSNLELARSSQAKSEFLARMSHELR